MDCDIKECSKDPIYTEEYIVPSVYSTPGETDGITNGYITQLQQSVAAMKAEIAGLQHDIANLTDLMPTIVPAYKSSPKPTDVYSAEYINSKIGGNG